MKNNDGADDNKKADDDHFKGGEGVVAPDCYY